jgi:hypothetical protein
MKHMLLRGAVFVGMISLAAGAPSSSNAQTSPASDKLQPMAFLAGSCWKGTFAGRAVTDEHCFRWIMNGHFLRDRHTVRGDSVPYEGESTYAWDTDAKRIVYLYIALPGFYSHGYVEPAENALVFHDHLATPSPRQLHITWTRTGADSYTVRVQDVTDATARELWSMVMTRSRAAPE